MGMPTVVRGSDHAVVNRLADVRLRVVVVGFSFIPPPPSAARSFTSTPEGGGSSNPHHQVFQVPDDVPDREPRRQFPGFRFIDLVQRIVRVEILKGCLVEPVAVRGVLPEARSPAYGQTKASCPQTS